MNTPCTEEKKRIILGQETKMARQLASIVLEKPEPPFWASFIPMVFVFYAHKLKQYSSGLDEFAHNYLVLRKDALESAIAAKIANAAVDVDKLFNNAGDMPPPAKHHYLRWIALLTDHYLLLLNSDGNCHATLVRSGYDNKAAYLSFCACFIEAEQEFNLALLPGIEGEAQDLFEVVQKMNMGIANLTYHEADMIFFPDTQALKSPP